MQGLGRHVPNTARTHTQPSNHGCRHVLTSGRMYTKLESVRSIMAVSSVIKYEHVFEPLLLGEAVPPDHVDTARRLVRAGKLLEIPGQGFEFISPLHRHYYLAQVCTAD